MAAERRFPPWMPNKIRNEFLPPLQGGPLLSMYPGVETPGSVLWSLWDKEFYTI